MQNNTENIDFEKIGKNYENSVNNIVRKREGIFFTPDFITKYICENTIGELCKQKQKDLNFNELTLNNLLDYKNWLLTLKILDPACGNGVFLNQALDFLINEHETIDNQIYSFTKTKTLFSAKEILKNNIYGVDIDAKSLTIAKYYLNLKINKNEKFFIDLNQNLKCGNSLIDDTKIAGEKAFIWEAEFSEIMQNGGFDCVVGNPPYVRSRELDNSQNEFINSKYQFILSGFDLATLFIEKGLNLIKSEGVLGFITTNKFFTARYGYKLRKYLIDNKKLRSIINLKSGIFADTPVETAILIISNATNNNINYTQLKPVDAYRKIEPIEILSFDTIQKAPNYIVYLPIDEKQKIINSKIASCEYRLKDFFKFSAGAGITGIENKLVNRKSEIYEIPVYTGSNVWRYFSTDPTYWTSKNSIRNFNANDYILIRELSTKNRAVYFDKEEIISGLNSVTFVKPSQNDNDKYKFILLFNSHLFGLLYELFYETTRTHSNLRYKEIYLSEIPVFDLNLLDTEECEKLFKNIYNLTFEKNTIESNFLNLLQTEFKDIKLTNKLKLWHLLNHIEFLDEIKKQKFEIKLTQKNEWIQYFRKEQIDIAPTNEKIKSIEKQINDMIYKFYKLTKKEITLIDEPSK